MVFGSGNGGGGGGGGGCFLGSIFLDGLIRNLHLIGGGGILVVDLWLKNGDC